MIQVSSTQDKALHGLSGARSLLQSLTHIGTGFIRLGIVPETQCLPGLDDFLATTGTGGKSTLLSVTGQFTHAVNPVH